ncbi:hypothetical protein COV20_01570 [Candidatus Woesearchaeota archaeon CG10_big_fil_rev_8_21_14_0_10_45_16]|nr:MAG: hypothetical protein COV20_01570 [Candidatus Woesearchaeota archaeon CG10_big_fil_rev_8_21_14_0_10_45_16]
MRPERMVKLRLAAPKSRQSAVIDTLYDLGLYHVTPHVKGKYELDLGNPLADAEELSSMIVKISSVLSRFPDGKTKKLPPLNQKLLSAAKKGVTKLYADFLQVEEGLQKIKAEKETIDARKKWLKVLSAARIDIRQLKQSMTLCHFFGAVQKKMECEAVLKENDDVNYILKDNILLVIGKKAEEKAIADLLNDHNFTAISLEEVNDAEAELTDLDLRSAKLIQQENLLQQRWKKIESETPTIRALEDQFKEEVKKQELPLQFGTTTSSFIAEGWIPKRDQERVQKALEDSTKRSIFLEFSEPDKKEAPPVKLHNNMFAKPFEFLIEMFSLPSYKEFDPTMLLLLTFPFFFGFMLGDLGYGVVLLIAFYILKKKVPAAAEAAKVLMFAAFVSMLFGLVYGEVFGFEHVSIETGKSWCDSLSICLPQHTLEVHGQEHLVADFPRLLNRAHSHTNVFGFEILTVLVIGAIIGFIHLNFGFILGFLNELKSHGFKHALEAKLSWMIIELGAILAVMSVLGMLSFSYWIGTIIAILGVVLLAKGEGIQGIVELPALISQTLSYMRLGAVGLASVGLAVVVNENLAMPFIERGGFYIIIAIIIMLFGHLINLLLGVIGPFLHGIRLHYVEFFSKFFHGGGVEYRPFKKEQKNKPLEVQ